MGLVLALCGLICFSAVAYRYFVEVNGWPRSILLPTVRKPMTTEEVVARSEGSVAMVRGRKGHGTGFLVGEGLVVTNAHVVGGEAASDLEVTFPSAASVDRGPFPAKLVYRDTHRDIALLLVASKLPPLELDDSPGSKRGRDVVIIGCPGIGPIALENAIAKGVMGPRVGFGSLEFDQLTAAINPGNSGGPVIDTKGRVVGVATLMATQQQSLALCIPASEVAAAVTRHVAHPGVSVAEPPRDAERFASNPILPAPSVAADALLSPPNDDPTASPAVRLASCDVGGLLPESHPKVKAAADLLESAKLLFRQDDRVIVELVIDVVARLRERHISARASDALSAMVECAPAPDSPEKRRDAAVYALLYFRCKSSSQVHAEAILCMRKSVEAMERNRDNLVTGRTRLPIDRQESLDKLLDARGRQRVAPDPRAFDDPGQLAKPAPKPVAPIPRAFDDPGQLAKPAPKEPAFLNRPGSEAKIPIALDVRSIDQLAQLSRYSRQTEAEKYIRSAAFFHVDDWTKVEVVKQSGLATLVVVLDGAHEGQQGWVPVGFVRYRRDSKVPGRAATLLQAAKNLEAAGKPKQARTYYLQIISEYPDSAEAKDAKKAVDTPSPKP